MADLQFSGGPVAATAIDELVLASRILARQGVLDAWGHVSMRHPGNPARYLMSRARAPSLVTAADIMEFDIDSSPTDQRGRKMFIERYIHGEAYRARPDVMAIVHFHAPDVIPFGVTGGGALSQSKHCLVGFVGFQMQLAELGGSAKTQWQHA